MFMSTKKRLLLAISALVLCIIVGYFLFTPDLLAFQTRVIAVKLAYRNDQSVIETLKFTEQIENIRAKYEIRRKMTPDEAVNRDDEVMKSLNPKQDIQQLTNFLRIYAKAMYLSTDDTGTYQVVFFETLRKIRDVRNTGVADPQELANIKKELNLNDTDSGAFDAILANKPFP